MTAKERKRKRLFLTNENYVVEKRENATLLQRIGDAWLIVKSEVLFFLLGMTNVFRMILKKPLKYKVSQYENKNKIYYKFFEIGKYTMSFIILLICIVGIVVPIWFIFSAAFTYDSNGQWSAIISFIPDTSTIKNFEELFDMTQAWGVSYRIWWTNSIIIAICTMILEIIILSFTAYAFSRFKFFGKKYSLLFMLIIQLIPTSIGVVAFFEMYRIFAGPPLMISVQAFLILSYTATGLPSNTFLLKGYMDNIPKDLDEAARIDGAGYIRILYKIVLPLSKPMLLMIALWSFMGPFTDFIGPRIIATDSTQFTLPVGLWTWATQAAGSKYLDLDFAAGSLIIAVPVAILILSCNKHLTSGATDGASKG